MPQKEMSVKQVIVFRRDLKVRKGKVAVQVAHAAMAFIADQIRGSAYSVDHGKFTYTINLTEDQHDWFNGLFTKICLVVDGEKELVELFLKAKEAGLTAHLIKDAGLTEFHGVPTLTCVAIGPDRAERIDAITSGLDLF